MIRIEAGYLLECVELYGIFSNKSEMAYVEGKHCCYFAEYFMEESSFSKCYDKSNVNALILSF